MKNPDASCIQACKWEEATKEEPGGEGHSIQHRRASTSHQEVAVLDGGVETSLIGTMMRDLKLEAPHPGVIQKRVQTEREPDRIGGQGCDDAGIIC